MFDRRTFMGLSAAAGAATLTAKQGTAHADAHEDGREFYELRRVTFETQDQRDGFDTFIADAAIPALNRAGIGPIGAFHDPEDPLALRLLVPYPKLETLTTIMQTLAADEVFQRDGAGYFDAPASSPAYTRISSSLMIAFAGMPKLERPAEAPGRTFQLRIYESPSVATGQKKIEMFNIGEIDIFRKTGLNPVFFGETIVGDKMPNLTYMLGFNSMDEQEAAWKTFIADPEWKELSGKPEYANDLIISGITNINVKPTGYSQI